jgi:copper chaperone CopZ
MSAEHTYKFNVSMSCGGCSGAVNRVLGKLDGLSLLLLYCPSTPFHDVLSISKTA